MPTRARGTPKSDAMSWFVPILLDRRLARGANAPDSKMSAGVRMNSFDVIIIGGGVIGSSVAYHLLRADAGLRVAMVERDPTFARASSALSAGNARIQFSLQQNIEISQYTFQVLQNFAAEMAVDDVPPEVGFHREGNLFLIDEAGRASAMRDLALQTELGCEVEWWSPEKIRSRHAQIETGTCVGATFGPGEGHLDGYGFLMGYRNKAKALGARVVTAEVDAIEVKAGAVIGVRLTDGERLRSNRIVNCAGAWAAGIAATAGVSIPVRPVQRQAFVVEPEIKPPAPLPLTSLPSGLYFRSESEDRLLVGKSLSEDRVGIGFKCDESRFYETLWPELVEVVPSFESLRLTRGWAGLYAVNTLDSNAILGEWPEFEGLFLANGFSGHGLQQAPAVGRYIAELIRQVDPVLDLSIFAPDRILEGRPVVERSLV